MEFVLIISGMPGVGKSTLAINLVKKYREFRSLNQMNLLRFATTYYNDDTENSGFLPKGLRFRTHEEGKQHMLKLVPVIEAFIKRQLEKKIPTILEGIDFYPSCLFSCDKDENFLNKVLFVNLYCSNAQTHYTRLTEREAQRQRNPSSVDVYFDNIRKKNNLLHQDILQLEENNMKSLDIVGLNKKQVLRAVESIIKQYLRNNSH